MTGDDSGAQDRRTDDHGDRDSPTGPLRFEGDSRSRVGQVRVHNEDNCLVGPFLLAVADGMGGHAAGEVASALAVEVLDEDVARRSIESIVDVVGEANSRILEAAVADPAKRGMGTTLCLAAVVQSGDVEMLAVANVGDSRVYLLADGALHQLSEDHSLVETLVREGRITPEEAATHPQRNVLTRALGVDRDVMVDVWMLDPRPGDRLLLCSDGLFNEVDVDRIEAMLAESASPSETAEKLVQAADDSGGRDNITVVVADVVGATGSPETLGSRLRWMGTSTSAHQGESPTSDDTASVPVVTPTDLATTSTARATASTDQATIGSDPQDLEAPDPDPDPDSGPRTDQPTIDTEPVEDTGDRPTIEPDGDEPVDSRPTADPDHPDDTDDEDYERDDDGQGDEQGPVETDPDGAETRGPRWRVIAFLVAIIAVLAFGVGALVVHERQGWTVRSRGDEVIIHRGRSESPPIIGSSGLVVVDDISVDELTEVVRRKLEVGERFETRSKADAYVEGLRDSTTTTTTTTTTVPPTTTTQTAPPTGDDSEPASDASGVPDAPATPDTPDGAPAPPGEP